MMLLIEQSKCWRCCWLKGQNAEDVVADRTSQSAEYVADRKGPSAEDVVANWKIKMLKMLLLIEPVKVLKMLLIERSKCWRCRCWLKGQNAEDVVADRTVKVLKMLLIERVQVLKMSLLIERSKCWRCCWWWRLKIEDEDYMMLKSFQWFIDVLPCWCWWCPLSLLLLLLM